MCMAVNVHSSQAWIFVCFNSFVHTVMYGYYCYSSLGYKFKHKWIITKLQMGQLISGCSVGMSLVFRYYFFGNGCTAFTTPDATCCVTIMAYSTVLVLLFQRFYKKSYKKAPVKVQTDSKKKQ